MLPFCALLVGQSGAVLAAAPTPTAERVPAAVCGTSHQTIILRPCNVGSTWQQDTAAATPCSVTEVNPPVVKHPWTRLGLARCFYLDAIVTIMASSPTLLAGFWRGPGVCRRVFLAP